MKTILLLLFSFSLHAQINIVAGRGPGGADTSAPSLDTSTSAADPVIGVTGVTGITVTITSSKPIINPGNQERLKTNATLSSFTVVNQSLYTVFVLPTASGNFKMWVPAGVCEELRGTVNTASDTINMTFTDATGYDIQNAALLTKAQHYRGHHSSWTDCTDAISTYNLAGGEMLMCKYNVACTQMTNSTSSLVKDIYHFGRCDYGVYTHRADTAAAIAFATDVRDGHPPSISSYGSGNTSYKTYMQAKVLYSRNSLYENIGQMLPITYSTGLSAVDMSSRGVTMRWDTYAEMSSANFLRGTQAQGDSVLAAYASCIQSASGWYSNFCHWAWESGYTAKGDYWQHYLEQLKLVNVSEDAFFGNASTVAEYYWVREAIDSVRGNAATVTVYYSKKYPSSPYQNILTPAWVKMDLTGTVYAGNNISTSVPGGRIRSVGSNVYYVSVPLDFTTDHVTFTVSINTGSTNYANLTIPTVTRSGNTITIDRPAKGTLYSIAISSVGTSTTSKAIPTSHPTDVTITTQTGLTLYEGFALKIYNDATHYFVGRVLSYNSGTGSLVIRSGGNVGTGTFSSWTVYAGTYETNGAVTVERALTTSTTQTIAATLTPTTKKQTYAVVSDPEQVSAVLEF